MASTAMVMLSVAMKRATPAAAARRAAFAIAITTRRSMRSTMIPDGTLNSSHGTYARALSSAIATGSLVIATAARGIASLATPSARLEVMAAPQRRPKPPAKTLPDVVVS